MTKRSKKSRSARRAAAAEQRKRLEEQGNLDDGSAANTANDASDDSGNNVLLLGVAAIVVIGLILVWLLATPWSPLKSSDGPLTWSEPPAVTISTNKDYSATIKTANGDIRIELYDDQAPITVNNFVFLARQGYYDNTMFHRVMPGFMAQAGDPTGTGTGGPGYTFADEFDPALRHDDAGIVSMANRGANTNGSQFFITYAPQPHLDDAHTVFGKVVEGMDVLESLQERDPSDPNAPDGTAILTVEIEES